MAISFSQSCIISGKEDVVEMDADTALTETRSESGETERRMRMKANK
jgi:hypothetical protein